MSAVATFEGNSVFDPTVAISTYSGGDLILSQFQVATRHPNETAQIAARSGILPAQHSPRVSRPLLRNGSHILSRTLALNTARPTLFFQKPSRLEHHTS